MRREMLVRVVRLLTVNELVVAVLRADGLSDREIARLLEVQPAVISRRMMRAQERIVLMLPEAAEMVAGRRRSLTQRHKGAKGGGRR